MMKSEASTTPYTVNLYSILVQNIVRPLFRLPVLLFWGVFVVLSFITLMQALVQLHIIPDTILGEIIIALVLIFFAPLHGTLALLTHGSFSIHGGLNELIAATSTWFALLGFFVYLWHIHNPRTRDTKPVVPFTIYRTTLKRVAVVFFVCMVISLIAGNYKGALMYALSNVFFVLPLSLSIPLYYAFERRMVTSDSFS